jgi:hypothetical protein
MGTAQKVRRTQYSGARFASRGRVADCEGGVGIAHFGTPDAADSDGSLSFPANHLRLSLALA